ncbi:MAG: SUMF1/EgtB/PvdO family nonheme iron enzyme [Planctomycetes bacterium]|nr:SUMF1/EgtB/PvdO family nonheme iron enzyme [Planctomycetota bacterium]
MANETAKARRVFISYTAEDLVEHAESVKRQIERLGWVAVDHRTWPATGRPSVAECRERVRSCAILVVLVAHRYGWIPTPAEGGDGERSITWLEVAEAITASLEVLPFVVQLKGVSWPTDKMEVMEETEILAPLNRFKAQLNQTLRGTFTEDPVSVAAPALDALRTAGERLDAREAEGIAGVPAVLDLEPLVRYRRWVEELYRDVRLLGFGGQFSIKLPIDQVYVPLAVSVRQEGVSSKHRGVGELGARRISVEDAFRHAEKRGLRGVAMLGDPGAGKSTAALRVAWQSANPLQGPASLGLPPDLVPIVLRLRSRQAKDGGLREFLERELRDRYLDDSGMGARLWQRPRRAELRAGAGRLWILDGLDEVADLPGRRQVSGWIEDALRDRPEDRFLVTSRYAGYEVDVALTDGFLEVHVQPLTALQQAEFVGRWFRTVETRVASANLEALNTAEARRVGLLGVLRGPDFRSQRLMSMAANPLLLSILCVVFREGQDLPRRRADLYQKCVEVLLQHWRREMRRAAGLSSMDVWAACDVLKPIAWWLHEEDNRTDAAASELAPVAVQTLTTLSPEVGLGTDGLAFLKRVRDDAGLLVNLEAGRYSFLHLSFQEYLAAGHACDGGLAGLLAGQFGHSWWKEVVLLALSQGSAEFAREFFFALLAGGRAEEHAELFSLALLESRHRPIEPFLRALQDPAAPPPRLALILGALSGQKDAALVEAARALASHPEARVAAAAAEVLLRAGVAAPRPQLVAGAARLHEKSGVTLVYIPAGEFDMGSPESDAMSYSDERPMHRVHLSAFWMGKFAITNEEYGRFLQANPGVEAPVHWTNSRFNGPRQPVVGVEWAPALAYCTWAGMSLPTEAQWEYACRAGSSSRWCFGDSPEHIGEHAWYGLNSGERTHPVGEKQPNVWGLFDVHGNVWEWCADTYGTYHAEVVVEPPGPGRLLRGGAWNSDEVALRCAYRGGNRHLARNADFGFRVVMPAGTQ